MSARHAPRILSIPAGVPFLPTLADALLAGHLVPGFEPAGDPLALADATIYVPTRRAARTLRTVFVKKLGGRAAILPTIRPLGEFDEDGALFETGEAEQLAFDPPIAALDRLLLLAPLVQAWKRRLPAHLARLYAEELVVPASLADAVWLARDLGDLIDEIETEGADWNGLGGLASGDLANWWQVTLDFLRIVTEAWPAMLAERGRSNPAAHRNATIAAETARLTRNPPAGPVIAAGSTGSIPATAALLSTIARLPSGAVILPGYDPHIDAESWKAIGDADSTPSSFGHPQTAIRKLLETIGAGRDAVEQLAQPEPVSQARMRLVGEALRPSETTENWSRSAGLADELARQGALDQVTLVEAANEREEALAIAVALRLAIAQEGRNAALVTSDRALARRVCVELERFGIEADDSGGTPLRDAPPAALLRLLLAAIAGPGDPVPILALLKHPLLSLGMERALVREAAETIELVALRGAVGRPDIAELRTRFERRLGELDAASRKPFWLARLDGRRVDGARMVLEALERTIGPLATLRREGTLELAALARLTVECLENAGRGADGAVADLYAGDTGERLAGFLRDVLATASNVELTLEEWPDVLEALMAGETVKPRPSGDGRVAIWGTLEARLQPVDTLVLGGLNEGVWPRRVDSGRFMSRMMKSGLELMPPERRIGQAAHDFYMAMGAEQIVLTRAVRSADAPTVESRWLQRLKTFTGKENFAPVLARGADLLHWARALDDGPDIDFAERPQPKPPIALRPADFSVTEIETLRRDPYAIYARRILDLHPLDPVLRDPGASERGSLFHDILHAFLMSGTDANAPQAGGELLRIGRALFDRAGLPTDIDAIWWPRFRRMAKKLLEWEQGQATRAIRRVAEIRAAAIEVGATGQTLRGRADRIDVLTGGRAEIIDFKTGLGPSKTQAHRLVAPQLALEGALLMRGAFEGLEDQLHPVDLLFVRLRPNGDVKSESVLTIKESAKSAVELSAEAWDRLEKLLAHYQNPETGYLSRALPFRETDTSGDYDHLARVREWSASGDAGEGDSG